MAKILFSSIVSDMRGSIAGTVYSANKNGAYTRNKGTMTNRNTEAQQVVRLAFSAVTSKWRALNDAQRNSFKEKIPQYPYTDKLGQTKFYTAFQLFLWQNNSLRAVAPDWIESCLTPVTLPLVESFEVSQPPTTANDKLSITFGSDGGYNVPDDYWLLIEGTDQLAAGITEPKRPAFKKIAVFAAGTDMSDKSIFVEYKEVFTNQFLIGNNIYLRATLVSAETGQRTTPIQVRASIVS